MRIEEITWRHRNDFHFTARCEHCDHLARYGDGYADHFYCTVVIPHRYCPECGKNSYGEVSTEPCQEQSDDTTENASSNEGSPTSEPVT